MAPGAFQGVSGGRIATVVAVGTSPAFWSFLLAPFLDVRLRRRTYVIVFGVLAAAPTAGVVLHHSSAVEVEAVMIVGFLSAVLFSLATGSWTGSLIEKEQDSRLDAWITVFNIGGNAPFLPTQ